MQLDVGGRGDFKGDSQVLFAQSNAADALEAVAHRRLLDEKSHQTVQDVGHALT